MPSVLAIVSKAIFERDAKQGGKVAGVGAVVPIDRYISKNQGLSPASEDGSLFLVTVRPPDEKLWLVAILEAPKFDGEAWTAAKNTVPIRDISGVRDQIKFVTGAGISAKKGALGMSLQTPRVLADADVAILRAGAGGAMLGGVDKGHLNAHERSGPTPCLCRKCIANAPEKITIGDLVLVRERAKQEDWFLWFWMPESLAPERDQVRRAVESRLAGRLRKRTRKKYGDLDKVLAGGGGGDDEDEGDDE